MQPLINWALPLAALPDPANPRSAAKAWQAAIVLFAANAGAMPDTVIANTDKPNKVTKSAFPILLPSICLSPANFWRGPP